MNCTVTICGSFGLLMLVATTTRAQPTTAPTTRESDPSSVIARVAANRAKIEIGKPPPSTAGPGEGTGGGRTGDSVDLPQPIVFAEHDQPGLTISANPTLYFFIPKATKSPALVTLSDPDAQTTLGRYTFDEGFAKAGIYRVQLSDLKEPLQAERTYAWTISIKSPKGKSVQNTHAFAQVRFVSNPELAAKVAALNPEERARALGENAIWYDAIAALCEAIDANPSDQFLRAERTRLLTERRKENAASFEKAP